MGVNGKLGCRPIRLAAVAAGPVIYQAPLYRALASDSRIELTVLFASSGGVRPYNGAFGGRPITWDEDLLAGYRSEFLERAAANEVVGGFFALRDGDVMRRIGGNRYDVLWVHGFSYLTMWLAMTAATLGEMPILLREEQTLLHGRPWPKRWIREAILRTLFSRVHGLYIGSNNQAFFRRYGVPDHRLFFAPYCADNECLQRQASELRESREDLRASFGVAKDAGPVVLFVGKLMPKKQPLALLHAFQQVRERWPCALLLVGEGELERALKCEVAKQDIPDVHFAGFLNRSEITRAYAAADVFVLPSAYHETWGIVVNEAMNFSLPVVVSDKVGCAADLVHEGENGYVVPHRDLDRLTWAIEALVGDPERRRRFGARSRDLIDGWHYGLAVEGIVRACEAALAGREERRR